MKSEEIAKIAGVSRSTVSRVINNYSNVPEETREKVMKVIQEYHYEPNTSARVLAGKGTDTIGLFLFSVHDKRNPFRVYGNSYFGPFVDAVVDTGNYKGYYIMVHTIYDPSECWRIRQTFSQKRIDAGIIIGTERNKEIEAIISDTTYPLAIVDYDPDEVKKLMPKDAKMVVVNSDDRKGMSACVDYLVSLGHKQIGLLEGRDTTYSGFLRKDEFQKRIRHHGLSLEKEFILKGEFIRSSTEAAVKKLIKAKKLPTAIIACNDQMAISAMEVFKQHGIRVPDDVSIIGYDDSPAATVIRPSLTTVRIPFFHMAQTAIESLSDILESKETGLQTLQLDVELVIRESCKKRT
ncbi:MAG: LacI family transcriptional regulator [Clostridia bacterium]|nr:LacI family transcriptional regulator [Clostridia bacterium]